MGDKMRELWWNELEMRPMVKVTQAFLDYQLQQRNEFEDQTTKEGSKINVWVKYARWEEKQQELKRATCVWERAIKVNPGSTTLWLGYAKMEMKNKYWLGARDVLERAVSALPMMDQLWYKYIDMEESSKLIQAARDLFERWTAYQMPEHGWAAYIKFELRYCEIDRARALFDRYVDRFQTVEASLWYVNFEVCNGEINLARDSYNMIRWLVQEGKHSEQFSLSFDEFLKEGREFGGASSGYKYAIGQGELHGHDYQLSFLQKQLDAKHGNANVLVRQQRFEYEDQLDIEPDNYDLWLGYVKLEERVGEKVKIRDVYQRAVANTPQSGKEKSHWQKYIRLWIDYAVYEELGAQDINRTRDVYKECLGLIPHNHFSFSKIWILSARFEVRQKNLSAARLILDKAIEVAPKCKIFETYLGLELQDGNVDNCRTLYKRYLKWDPSNCQAWISYAQLETLDDEIEKARFVFDQGMCQPILDRPELLWTTCINFEIAQGEKNPVRELCERLLTCRLSQDMKAWLSYARPEAQIEDQPTKRKRLRCQRILKRACKESWLPKERRRFLRGERKIMERGFATTRTQDRGVKRKRETRNTASR